MEKASTLPKVPTLEADSSFRTQSVEPTLFQKGTARISHCWTSINDGIERLNQYKLCKPAIFGMKMQFKTFCGGMLSHIVTTPLAFILGIFKISPAELLQDQFAFAKSVTTNRPAVDFDSVSSVASALVGVFAESVGAGLRSSRPSTISVQIPNEEADLIFGYFGAVIPWKEEFIFRYIIQDVILTKVPRAILGRICPEKTSMLDTELARLFRVTLTAALFSGYHLTNLGMATDRYVQTQLIDSFVTGLFLGAIKESSLGFFGAVGFHVAKNQWALLQTFASA
jgi:membrane protease YdiL (CAAX protease family)